jgi:hypothetical protein
VLRRYKRGAGANLLDNIFVSISLAFLTSLLLPSLHAEDQRHDIVSKVRGISLIADSRASDRLYGARMRIDLGELSLSELRDLKISYGDVQDLLARSGDKLEVLLFAPKSEVGFAQKEFSPSIHRILSERYDTQEIVIKVVAIDVHEVNVLKNLSNDELSLAKRSMPLLNEQEKNLIDLMKQKNHETADVINNWNFNFRDKANTAIRDYESTNMMFGSVIGAVSSVSPIIVWLSTTGVNPFGLGQAFMQIVYDQVNTTYSSKLIKFENEHKLPTDLTVAERIKRIMPGLPAKIEFPKVLKRAIKFYNINPLLKAFSVNFAINSGTGFAFKTASWLSAPNSVSSPISIEFLASLGGINVVSGIMTGAADVGIRQMRMKGRVSPRTEILVASSFNFLASINNLFIGSGMTHLLPVGLALEWGVKGSIFTLGKILPTKSNRFYMILPGLDEANLDKVKKMHDLNESLSQKDFDSGRFKEMLAGFDVDDSVGKQAVAIYAVISGKLNQLKEQSKKFITKTCLWLKNLWG